MAFIETCDHNCSVMESREKRRSKKKITKEKICNKNAALDEGYRCSGVVARCCGNPMHQSAMSA